MAAGRRGRIRTAAGWTAAVALVSGVALSGCEAEPGGGPGAASRPSASPSPRPTPAWDTSPASVAAVGDSITRGFDACGLLVDCPEVSWATGGDARVNSLARRLVGPSALPARSWNLARSGARMAELPGQMAAAGAKKPGLVTVMAGANDACRDSTGLMTPVSSFRSSFEEAMRALRAVSPKSQVYVSSVPDLKRLWTTGRGSALGKQVWKLGVCRSMLGDADDVGAAAVERREEVYRRVVAYNEVLRDVCAKDRLCRYDGGAVFDYRFTGAQLSPWDWFHPSTDGQGRLAEIAYRIVTS
ncbi:SGNH/GDSL hydrolase family protein [Streptomyces sp. WAC05374]|uniref:SGNH/GDSL hydrolase family protein n=1 Tax=Streptomyces sp. WAC05374 TaxID=2487420 RepID=UPI000F871462|nr:SGNH/GDSL hydrolase family protein [Streptomyces sp. WAC05374]RST18071.1 SGNH/GDSL hydrolase family protein [Streptomyces sp. WAC05374]TDF45216.1 SGNH/GDSL hydrolase family protein [Streptomyces sp. WAC05374]TDF55796.1 SGNH/GDSL hydrolase family protein [Streptomyces sp. WAC05374]TDF58934.1 SGNH/GDSL hydrolase family protein [Streptomyces sp. WAC05374]